jgi:hypothetical protein
MEQPAKNLREKKLHREHCCLLEVEDEMREKRDAE